MVVCPHYPSSSVALNCTIVCLPLLSPPRSPLFSYTTLFRSTHSMNIVTNLRITTSVKTNASLYKQVEDAFHLLNKNKYIQNISIIKRKKLTIKQIFKSNDSPVIVYENTGPKLYFTSEILIYFHLHTTKIKLNMVKNQQQQPILSEMINHITSKETSFNFVDGTMGFGRDSYLVLKQFPNVNVFSIEQHPLIHFVLSAATNLHLPPNAPHTP